MLHVCEYEVNRWTNEKLLEENKILRKLLTTPDNRRPGRIHQSICQKKSSKNPANNRDLM